MTPNNFRVKNGLTVSNGVNITAGDVVISTGQLVIGATTINATSMSVSAQTAYSNAVSYTDTKIGTANTAMAANAATAYSNAVSYTDTKIGTANTAMVANAAAAYTNAIAIAANATNITSGTVAFARLPSLYLGTTTIQSTSAAQAVSGITTLAAGNTTITGFANVTSTLQVGTNTATFGTAAYVVSNGNVGIGTSSPGAKLDVRGNLAVGGADAGPNFISFRGTTLDGPGSYEHTFIGERIHTATEASELFLFKGNDPSSSGPDRVRIGASEFRVDTYATALNGPFETVANSANLTTHFIVTNGGNVGIGNTAPGSKLVVAGAAVLGNTTVSGTAALGNTTITGFANVTSTIQGGSSLAIAGALSGVTTAAMGNTTITGFANVTSTLQVGGISTFSANVVLGSVGVSANGGFGTSGHVLHTNGTATYWAADDNTTYDLVAVANTAVNAGLLRLTDSSSSNDTVTFTGAGTSNVSSNATHIIINSADQYLGTVTSIVAANGLNGGTITSTGTMSVLGGSTLTVNSTGAHVNSALSITSLALSGDLTVSGNLTVSGTRTYVNTTTLDIGDNIFTLNADLGASAPSQDAGIEIMRGTSANVQFLWDETNDRWSTNGQSLAVSSLVAAGALSGVTTAALGNTTITGFANVTSTLQVGATGSLGGTATNFVNNFTISTNNGNSSHLRFYTYRHTTGADWTGASTRIQQRIDVTDQAYIEFNPNGYSYGVGLFNSTGKGLVVDTNGITNYTANVVFGSVGLSSNGGFGTAGQVLHSNGTATYWAADDQGVTSVATANGLTGGTITSTGTLGVATGSTLTVNTTGIHVNSALQLSTLNLSGGANTLAFTNATSNWIQWNTAGVAAPALTTRSAGTKMVLYPLVSGSAVDYALGVEGNHLWFSAPTSGTDGFKWYTGTTNIMTANAAGLNLNTRALSGVTTAAMGNTTITGFANVTSTIQGGSSLTIAGALSGVTTAAMGNTTITGFANVTSTIQGGSSLTIAGALSGVTTAAMGNTTITGFANVSTTLQVGTNTATFGTAAYIVANGNVGIGMNTPTKALYVSSGGSANAYQGGMAGIGILSTDLTANGVTGIQGHLTDPGGTGRHSGAISFGKDGTWTTGSAYPGNIGFWTRPNSTADEVEHLRLTANGNFGIGTVSPATKLDVVGMVRTSDQFQSNGGGRDLRVNDSFGGTVAAVGVVSNNPLMFFTNNTEGMRIAANGNVGIGTSTPGAELETFNSTGGTQAIRMNTNFAGGNYIDINPFIAGVSNGGYSISANGSIRMVIDTSGNMGIGTTAPGYKLEVNGSFAATTKSFVIPHPTKPGMKLRYGSLEGPENGVYVRGRLRAGEKIIQLPDYWEGLVDEDTYTVNLTPVGKHQELYVEHIASDYIIVGGENIDCFYTVFAERNDVEKLEVEF